jgi:glucose-1-phosphatase
MTGDRVKLVCFDLGGVIIRHYRSWVEACAGLGVEFRAGIDTPELVALRRAASMEYQCGRIGTDEFYRRLAVGTAHLYAIDELRHVHTNWVYGQYEGIEGVLRRVVATPGVRTAVLSNTNAEHWARMVGPSADFPAPGILSNHHASHLLGCCKPDPRAYEAIERSVGCAPGGVLFFEDRADNAAAAAARGWQVELIDYTRETAPQVEAALIRHRVLEPGSA